MSVSLIGAKATWGAAGLCVLYFIDILTVNEVFAQLQRAAVRMLV